MTQEAKKQWTREAVLKLLETNDEALAIGIVRIYERQTADEKMAEDVKHNNGMGFMPSHARFLSSLAKFYLQRGYLTPKQIAKARPKMRKYAGQLLKVIKAKEATDAK